MMKPLAKRLCQWIATILVCPIFVAFLVARTLSTPNQAVESFSQMMGLFPGVTGNFLRAAFYRMALDQCDQDVTICFGVLVSDTRTRIGKNVYVGPRSMLGWVAIEDDVLVGPAVQIPSGPAIHNFENADTPVRSQHGQARCLTIGEDSWIGAASVILADVGAKAIVGANSTVTRTVDSASVVAGCPAKPIGRRGKSKGSWSDRQQTHVPYLAMPAANHFLKQDESP